MFTADRKLNDKESVEPKELLAWLFDGENVTIEGPTVDLTNEVAAATGLTEEEAVGLYVGHKLKDSVGFTVRWSYKDGFSVGNNKGTLVGYGERVGDTDGKFKTSITIFPLIPFRAVGILPPPHLVI